MRDGYKGNADLVLQVSQFKLHLRTQFGVERRQGFIEQQHLWPHHQTAREGNTLALPARHLVRHPVFKSAQFH